MKKMVMMFAAVAMAACAQATTINWQTTDPFNTIYDYTGTAIGTGAVAYLFDVATITQTDLLAAVRDGASLETLTSVDHASTSSSKIQKTPSFEYGNGGDNVVMYWAILDANNDQLLISSMSNMTLQAAGTTTFDFIGSGYWSMNTFGDEEFSTAGWYSTAAIPEPTSGLLVLIGMAGLALKRKVA